MLWFSWSSHDSSARRFVLVIRGKQIGEEKFCCGKARAYIPRVRVIPQIMSALG